MNDKSYLLEQLLNKLIDDYFDDEIISIALTSRRDVSLPARKKLEYSIRKLVKVNGFRDPLEAPQKLLIREIKKRYQMFPTLVNSILVAWEETKASLKEEARSYIEEQELDISNLFKLEGHLSPEDIYTDEFEITKEYLVSECGYNSKDIHLILWKLFQEAVTQVEVATTKDEEISSELNNNVIAENGNSVLERCLEIIAGISAESPEWKRLDDFIKQVQEVAELKKQERKHQLDVNKSKQLLVKIKNDFADVIDYFDFNGVKNWEIESCQTSRFPSILFYLEEMHSLLQDYNIIKHREETKIDAERKRRQQLTRIEDDVKNTYSQLLTLFNSSNEKSDTKGENIGTESQQCIEKKPDFVERNDSHKEGKVRITTKDVGIPAEEPDSINQETKEEVDEVANIEAANKRSEDISVNLHIGADSGEEVSETLVKRKTEKNEQITEKSTSRIQKESEIPDNSPIKVDIQDSASPLKTDEIQPQTARPTQDKPILNIPAQWQAAHEMSISLQQEQSEEKWQAFLWAMILEDDLAGAYWLARTLFISHRALPVPEWLMKAVQGARWLVSGTELFIKDLFDITQKYQPDGDNVQELMGIAVALYPALVAPRSGLVGWLKVPGLFSSFHNLVETVKTFANYGIPLLESDLMGIAGQELREALIKGAAESVAQWLESARKRRTKFLRATEVWQYLTGTEGDLRAILLPAAEDRRDCAQEVAQQIKSWMNRDYVVDRIKYIDNQLSGRRYRPITGDPREQLFRYVQEGCSLAGHWCSLVEKEHEISCHDRGWLSDRINELRNGIQLALPEVIKTLDELSTSTDDKSYEAAAYCMKRSLGQLCSFLQIPTVEFGEVWKEKTNWEWLTIGVEKLDEALKRRLLLLPELQLDDMGNPQPDCVQQIPLALCNAYADNRTWQNSFSMWIDKKDFRFTEQLWRYLGSNSDDDLYKHYQDELDGARAALEDLKQNTLNTIEQAVVDGIIGEERSEYHAVIEGIDPRYALDISRYNAILLEQHAKLVEAKRQRMVELQAQWQSLRVRLDEYTNDESKKQQIIQFVQSSLENEDTRVLEESVARLTRALDDRELIGDEWFKPRSEKHILQEFIKVWNSIKEGLSGDKGLLAVVDACSSSRRWAGLNLSSIARPQIEDIRKAVMAWRRLKQQGPNSREVPIAIENILRYLGFNMMPGAKTPVQIRQLSDNYLYAQVTMSAGGMSPVQQFGSQCQGYYDVVCVWERPSVDTMNAWLRDLRLANRYVLVFYLGRMTLNRRHGLRQVRNDKVQAFLVLDEILLAFLAAVRTARLPAFFQCSLPFTNINPYTPTGYVPPEMFFGRQEMARELQKPDGSCIVYGGRQLGKSALLRHVQREFHQPDRDQYAIVEDIKLIGDPASGLTTDIIWKKLYDSLTVVKLLPGGLNIDQPEDFISVVKNNLEKNQAIRVLVLLDETDNFLDADAKENFRVIDMLRILMQDTQQRFKVILAGLHNVQRFQGIRNQPLVHYGRPICVGPLEPVDAQRLINEPLHALGYSLEDESLVLRILSYTNYHPGLIQLFCQELLKRLQSRGHREMSDYPIKINRSDIEAVYRLKEVQEEIRKRFEWTLVLDRRYLAITLALIIDQLDKRNGFAQAYSTGDILRLAESWLEQDFARIRMDEFRGLLDEMCGLGVLCRNNEGNYRLRSPNLVHLMGTEAEIQDQLIKLEDTLPVKSEFDPDNWHVPLDSQARLYSPLTNAQVRNLNFRESGVGLIFASGALGFAQLLEACRRFVSPDLISVGRACIDVIPSEISTSYQLEVWLDQYLKGNKKSQQLILCRSFEGVEVAAHELVQCALSYCRRLKKVKSRLLSILFMFDTRATWEWLVGSEEIYRKLENMANATVFIHKWGFNAIRKRLAQKDKIDTEEVCQQVLDSTGGWPFLLDLLFDWCEGNTPELISKEICMELDNKDSSTAQTFRRQLGIEVNNAVLALIRFINDEGSLPLEFTLPDHIKDLVELADDADLTMQNCYAALEYVRRLGLVEVSPEKELMLVDPLVARVLMKQ